MSNPKPDQKEQYIVTFRTAGAADTIKILAERGFVRKVPTKRSAKDGRWLQSNNHYYIQELPKLPAPADRSA